MINIFYKNSLFCK